MPKKKERDPKQPSILGFMSPENKSTRSTRASPRKPNHSAEETNNNNNNNNNNETKKKQSQKSSSPKKQTKRSKTTKPETLPEDARAANVGDVEEEEPNEVLGLAGENVEHLEDNSPAEEVEEELAADEQESGDADEDFDRDEGAAVELSPTTATVVSPSGSAVSPFGSPDGAVAASDGTPGKQQPFKCKKCDQMFRNRYYMRKHMLMDHEHQLYKCRICSFTSVFPEKLKSHIIKQHVCKKEKAETLSVQTLRNENEVLQQQAPRKIIMIDGVPLGKIKKVPQCYICDVCGKVYSSKFSLERHVRCHTGERPYACDVCDFTTSYREHMQRHMTSVHLVVHSDEPRKKYVPKHKRTKEEANENEESGEEEGDATNDGSPPKKRRNILRKRFECAACGLKATHKSDLVEHIKEKHPKAHIVSLDNNDGSKVHLVVTASKKPRQVQKFTATCSYCSKVFNDNWKYMVHLRSHTGVKPFSCSECDFHATTKMTVRDHIHRKHRDCPDAKLILKLVNITDGSVEEVAIDVPQKEFKCEFCHEVFPGNYELKAHKFKDHPEAKPFLCTICEQREWGKAAMIIHCLETHPQLDVETLIQKNGKPVKVGPINLPKCDTCAKMFPYQSLLYLHQRTHTGERNYGCDSCDFRTDSKKALTRHILKKHLDTNLKVKPKRKKSVKDMAVSTEDDSQMPEADDDANEEEEVEDEDMDEDETVTA